MAAAKKGQRQLSETVATYLREKIISGEFARGEFLRIDAIAKTLDVSTTPVREGLLLLQSESLVSLIPRRGFVVSGISKEELLDLFWAQATVGAELAARAAQRMGEADIAKLFALNTAHAQAVAEGRLQDSEPFGYQFHRLINLAAGSSRLASLMGSLSKQLPIHFYTEIEAQPQDAVDYHPLIAQAIRLRDAPSARALMFRHLYNGGEHLVEMLERKALR